jgi:hypothetical protein
MAKIKVIGNAAVVTSSVKVADLQKLGKFKPASLKLIDKETKDELFAIGIGSASLNKFGASFPVADKDGFAEMTLVIPESVKADAKKAYVEDTYGYALLNLNKVEAQIADTLEVVAGDFAAISENIEVQ